MDKSQLAVLAENVAAWLPGWRFDATRASNQSIQLIGPNRARLFFGGGRWNEPNKFYVSGIYPHKYNPNNLAHGRASDYDFRKEDPRAGLSCDRSPKSLAADIKRRVLVGYLDNLKAAWVEREQYQEKLALLNWRANASKAALPGLTSDDAKRLDDYKYRSKLSRYTSHHSDLTNVSIEVNGHNKNDFNIDLKNVPDDLAFKILGLINQHEQGQ